MLLKDEGNDLHKQGKFREAAEKYKRAHSNMAAHTSQEGRNLRKVTPPSALRPCPSHHPAEHLLDPAQEPAA